MNKNISKLVDVLGETRVSFSEPLSKYSSFHIGGPADLFYRARSTKELVEAVTSSRKFKIPTFVLGGGTNVLIADRGFGGLVIKNDTSEIRLLGIKGKKTGSLAGNKISIQRVYLEAESGVTINRLVRFTLDQGIAGLQYFLGQPGTVGGAMYNNAHNMKKRVFWGDRVFRAKILKRDGKIEEVSAEYFRFGYDQSNIRKTGDLVLSVILGLERDDKEKLWKQANDTLEYRWHTQPAGVFSAGCIFRNITKSEAIRLATPNYNTSAGFLLDSVGLKGIKRGEAMFSSHHANFITHHGKAKASDVLELILLAKKKVKERYNIDLVEEIVLMGDS